LLRKRGKKEEGRRKKEEGRRSAASGLTFLLPSTRSSELVGETDRDHGIGFEVAELRLQVFFFRPQVGLELSRRRRVLGDRAVGEEAHGRRTLQHYAEVEADAEAGAAQRLGPAKTDVDRVALAQADVRIQRAHFGAGVGLVADLVLAHRHGLAFEAVLVVEDAAGDPEGARERVDVEEQRLRLQLEVEVVLDAVFEIGRASCREKGVRSGGAEAVASRERDTEKV